MSNGWGWGWGLQPSGGGTYFQDTMTESTGQLAAHSPDIDVSGDGWTEDTGDWQLSVSYVSCLEDDAEHMASCDADVANCTVEVDAKYDLNAGDVALGLIVRGDSDLANHWRVQLNPSNNRLEIVKHEFGETPSVEKYVAITDNFADNTAYTVSAVMSGNVITAHCVLGGNDDSVAETDSFNATETRHGLLGFHNTANDIQTFDNFSIVG